MQLCYTGKYYKYAVFTKYKYRLNLSSSPYISYIGVFMLEEAIRQEIARLEGEIVSIDAQLQKLQDKMTELATKRKKYEHDLRALKTSFDEAYIAKEAEETLQKILKGQKVKA